MDSSRKERRLQEAQSIKRKRRTKVLSASVLTGMGLAMIPTAAFAAEIPPPVAPDTVDLCGTDNDTFTIPFDPDVTWYSVTGEPGAEVRTPLAPGTQPAGGLDVSLIATPTLPEDEFPGGVEELAYNLTFTDEPCGPIEAIVALPLAPIFTDNCGVENDILQVAAVEGITYQLVDVDGNIDLLPGENRTVSGDVQVVAVADLGFEIPVDVQVSWEYSFTDNPCLITVAPAAPVFTDEPGTDGDVVVIPESEGVDFELDGAPVESGTYPGVGDVTVVAVPETGYTIDPEATSTWSFSFDATAAPEVVVPAEPVFTDEAGTADDVIVIPESEGVVYSVDGVETAAGTYPAATGDVTVTAEAEEGYALDADSPSTWNFTFTDGDPDVIVSPAEPVFTDESGTADDVVVIPETEGVTYLLNDEEVGAGEHPGVDAVVVEAVADEGYALDPEETSTWNYTFDDAVDETIVSPAVPVFTDEEGTEADTVVIPETEGVSYLLNGDPAETGTYPATGSVTVEAVADEGYALDPEAVALWNYVFTDAEADVVVTPPVPVFTDEDGTENDVVVIPEAEGLDWTLNGEPIEAGEHPATGNITVAAVAEEGYALDPESASVWSYEFDPTAEDIVAAPAEPVFTDEAGTGNDVIVIPETEGVEYLLNDNPVTPGAYPAVGNVTIRAVPAEGFAFPMGAITVWNYLFDTSENAVIPAVPVPGFNDEEGTENDTVVLPEAEGIIWMLNGEEVEPGTYDVTGEVEVEAVADEGYVLPAGAVANWTVTFSTAGGDDSDNMLVEEVPAPAFNSATNVITIPGVEGLEYLLNGTVVEAGDYTITEDATVTVRALDGYELPAGAVTEWLFDYTVISNDDDDDDVTGAFVPGTGPRGDDSVFITSDGITPIASSDKLAYTGTDSNLLAMLGLGGLMAAGGAGLLAINRRKEA